jgi:hypothetical protein
MLEGVPEFVDYVIATVPEQPAKSSLAVVAYHLLGDVVNASDLALTHYLPLTLNEEYLQNSSIGSPYQKWAKFTTEDFRDVDHTLQRLMPVAWQLYEGYVSATVPEPGRVKKSAWRLYAAINERYRSCMVDRDTPSLTMSVINPARLLQQVTDQRTCDRPEWKFRESDADGEQTLLTLRVDISDRSVVTGLQRAGLERLGEMRASKGRFGEWLRSNYTMEDVTSEHGSTLNEGCFTTLAALVESNMPRDNTLA